MPDSLQQLRHTLELAEAYVLAVIDRQGTAGEASTTLLAEIMAAHDTLDGLELPDHVDGPVGTDHPATSRHVATLNHGSETWRVLDALEQLGTGNAWEVHQALEQQPRGSSSPNQVNTRMQTLRAEGATPLELPLIFRLTEADGITYVTRPAKAGEGVVHALTLDGLATIARLRREHRHEVSGLRSA